MLNKRGLMIAFLIVATVLSLFSLGMTFFSDELSYSNKGESSGSFGGNVQIEVLPSDNVLSAEAVK